MPGDGLDADGPMPVVSQAREEWSRRRMSATRLTGIALGVLCVLIAGCEAAMTDPAVLMTGTYVLDSVDGRGPANGILILTRQGYAERRVRFRDADGELTREFLARGTAEFQPDSTIALILKEIDPASEEPWTPAARLIAGGVQIRYYDFIDASPIVEIWRRQ